MDFDSPIDNAIKAMTDRVTPGGGFAQRSGGGFRSDATAWSILAFSAYSGKKNIIENACRQLAAIQSSDGRVPVADGFSAAYWTTPLAIMAWKFVGGFEIEAERAIQFLLSISGLHFPKEMDPEGHDISIKGWPWIEDTHSWVEPTSMAILALRVNGFSIHGRVREAVNMLLDRQLPSGGWNMGNTVVFGKELLPIPEPTGQALTALNGFTTAETILNSLNYLNRVIRKITTPLALVWVVFGMAAWNQRPDNYRELILTCLEKQSRYGPYDTDLLAQLILAYLAEGDLVRFLGKRVQYGRE